MKVLPPYLTYSIISQLLAVSICNAQSNKAALNALQAPPQNIAIDGDIKEWGDSLRYYNTEKKINYSIANDKENLYMAIRITDRLEQRKIFKAGITFSIDPKGKKKETFSITFPLNVQGGSVASLVSQKEPEGEVTKQDREELMRERITTLRGIKVVGFKDIEGDMITTSNTYGIQTAINYDENGNLICEAAIPLKFFHTDEPSKNEWAFNFKVNGLTRPTAGQGADQGGGGGGRGGRGGGGGGGGFGGGGGGGGGRGGHGGGGGNHSETPGEGGQSELFKSDDFWTKFYLAK
jgi:YD repeat-containing protein